MKRIADGHCHGRTAHCGCKGPHRILCIIDGGHRHCQKRNVKLCSDGIDDGSDQKRAEQALRHCSQCINSVSVKRYFNIFSFQKRFHFFHDSISFLRC